MEKLHYIISFDVHDNKRRRRLTKWLESFCERIQYSVFVMGGDFKRLCKVQEGIRRSITEDDSVFIFPIDNTKWNAKQIYGAECKALTEIDSEVLIL